MSIPITKDNRAAMKSSHKRNTTVAHMRPNQANQAQDKRPEAKAPTAISYLCEIDLANGLEKIVYGELLQQLGKRLKMHHPLEAQLESGALQFGYTGDLRRLLQLQTVLTAYLVCPFEIARPSALLGHENFQKLVRQINLEIGRASCRERV